MKMKWNYVVNNSTYTKDALLAKQQKSAHTLSIQCDEFRVQEVIDTYAYTFLIVVNTQLLCHGLC